MARRADITTAKGRLRRLLGLFFVALAIPSAVLTWQAYSRLQWESFHQHQVLAEALLGQIDRRLRDLIAREEARAFTDYGFLIVEGAPAANYLQRSPLSALPEEIGVPGLVGYFQVDADGRFTTPLLPEDAGVSARDYGVGDAELVQRQAVRERLLTILSQQGQLMATPAPVDAEQDAQMPPPATAPSVAVSSLGGNAVEAPDSVAAEAPVGTRYAASSPLAGAASSVAEKPAQVLEQRRAQAAFDRLSDGAKQLRKSKKLSAPGGNIGRVDELKLEQAFDADTGKRQAREPLPRFKERVEYGAASVASRRAPEAAAKAEADDRTRSRAEPAPSAWVTLFESEVDPFEFGLVGEAHFVLYRKVWRDGQRHIQGAVIDRAVWLRELLEKPFRETVLAGMSRLGIVFDDDILAALGGEQGGRYLSSSEQLSGTLLYRGRLSSPLDRLELIFSVTRLPSGSAGSLVIWVALTLGLILTGGLWLMYRLGIQQIELNRQQRDFVSAVSHELKTPLTSIRMYSEMLREGWADDARRRSYYDFIHDESERLSRLIGNVLQLARMSRDELKVEPRPLVIGALLDLLRSKVATQVAHAGFELHITCADDVAALRVSLDEDAFAQIMINLVDNAIKFSAHAEVKRIEIQVHSTTSRRIEFAVRDHGPGIARDQMKKIFKLFYRSENELTRETVGTGIGLALVHRLTTAMQGQVDVVNQEPGAEFRLSFPRVSQAD